MYWLLQIGLWLLIWQSTCRHGTFQRIHDILDAYRKTDLPGFRVQLSFAGAFTCYGHALHGIDSYHCYFPPENLGNVDG